LARKLSTIIDPLPSPTSESLKESGKIVINSLDPCLCGSTGLFRDVTGGVKIFLKVFVTMFARTAEEGSRLIVAAAAAGRETHGGYLRAGELREPVEMVSGARGVERGGKIWVDLAKRLEGMAQGVMDVVKD
jgi:retinol dehydrogenase-12